MASDPSEVVPTSDPLTAILVVVTEMRSDLKAALTEQGRHTTVIERHDATLVAQGNRLTALETTIKPVPARLEALEERKSVSPAVVWSAAGLAVAALAVLITFLALKG